MDAERDRLMRMGEVARMTVWAVEDVMEHIPAGPGRERLERKMGRLRELCGEEREGRG